MTNLMKKALSMLAAAAMLLCAALLAFSEEIDYTTGTPWPDTDLVGVVTADTETNLKDNYALAVNKDKLLSLEIPAGYATAGTMPNLSVQAGEDLKNMFLGDAPEGHDELLAYNYFQLLMDWDGRNALGIAPLKAQVDQVEAIGSVEELTAYLTLPSEDRLSKLWSYEVLTDLMDSSRNIIDLENAPLLLQDAAEYTALTPYGNMFKQAYTELARKMLSKLGYTENEAEQKIENWLAFETMIAASSYTKAEQKSPDFYAKALNYHRLSHSLERGLLCLGRVDSEESIPVQGHSEYYYPCGHCLYYRVFLLSSRQKEAVILQGAFPIGRC